MGRRTRIESSEKSRPSAHACGFGGLQHSCVGADQPASLPSLRFRAAELPLS